MPGRGTGEDHPPDALQEAPAPGDGDEAALRMAEDVEALEAEVLAHQLDVRTYPA